MQDDWPERLPPDFYQGLEQFNQGHYYQCHETLETLWLAERRPVRELYQGVLQIAVGCFHLTVRANFIGATRKLDAGARRLEHANDAQGERYGVDWSALISAADRLRDHLLELGLDRVSEHDHSLIPRVTCRLLDP